ncbi:MAG: hypothetical protein KatS3mg115_2450 [Candidatus Poribacteria bacterium]|nr:MAG: hypothetical protein KatS3mg115_2450 [Candidatus Poribacteria bacterium]
MSEARSLLKFSFPKREFELSAREIKRAGDRIISEAIRGLQELVDTTAELIPPPESRQEEVYRRFMAAWRKGGAEEVCKQFQVRRDLRLLGWALTYSGESGELGRIVDRREWIEAALKAFDQRFPGSSRIAPPLEGVAWAILSLWGSGQSLESLQLLQRYLDRRIQEYPGTRRSLLRLKEKAPFLTTPEGPQALARFLLVEGHPLELAPQQLGLGGGSWDSPYFQEVAVGYADQLRRDGLLADRLDELIGFLYERRNPILAKRVLAKVVPAFEAGSPGAVQKLCEAAVKLVGDPARASQWGPWPEATAEERAELEKAKQILNWWLSKDLIERFFVGIAMDEDRAEFWRRYLRRMGSVVILVDRYAYLNLELSLGRENREIFRQRVRRLTDSGGLSAIAMDIGNYWLFEFSSSGGAFYAYSKNNPYRPDIDKDTISIREIRRMSCCDYRLVHSSGWRYRLSRWLDSILFGR